MGLLDYLLPSSIAAKLTTLLLGQGRIETRLNDLEAQLHATKQELLAEIAKEKDRTTIQECPRPPNSNEEDSRSEHF